MSQWWNNNAEARISDFTVWVGDYNQPSKVYCRNYIAQKQYKNIIDCGCGLATDYFGFKNDNYDLNYTGLDSCTYFVNLNKECGIPMIEAELEGALPPAINAYDCVYCREVIEHLSSWKKTIPEMIRIASKEVIIVWFIKPEPGEDKINYWEEEDLYHNLYSKDKLEEMLTKHPKVTSFFWHDISDVPYVIGGDGLTEEERLVFEGPLQPEPEKPSGQKTILHILLK